MNKVTNKYFYDTGQFDVLIDAVLNEPKKVGNIVSSNRSITWAMNTVGENVLHYLAVENHIEGVELLRSVGSPISPWALTHALQAGHTDMVILLLELGADPIVSSCKSALESDLWKLDKNTKRLMRSYFKQYGHEV